MMSVVRETEMIAPQHACLLCSIAPPHGKPGAQQPLASASIHSPLRNCDATRPLSPMHVFSTTSNGADITIFPISASTKFSTLLQCFSQVLQAMSYGEQLFFCLFNTMPLA